MGDEGNRFDGAVEGPGRRRCLMAQGPQEYSLGRKKGARKEWRRDMEQLSQELKAFLEHERP